VNTLFLLGAGLDIFRVMVANAGFTVGQVLFEVPTGVIADTLGRRVSYLLSVAIIFASTLLYLVFGATHAGVAAFVLASLLLGLGFTFYTGAVDAWMVDALAHAGRTGTVDVVFARGGMAAGVAMLVGATAGGLLGQLGLWLPYVARAVMLIPAFVLGVVAMHDLGFKPRPLRLSRFGAEAGAIFRAGVTYGVRDRVVLPLMMVAFVVGVFGIYGFYSWQRYFLDLLGRELVWVDGVIAALVGLSSVLGNALVGPLSRLVGRRSAILPVALVVQLLAIVGAGLTRSFWVAVPLYLLATAVAGCMQPIRLGWLNERIPSAQRATMMSLDAAFGEAGGTVGQLGLGYLSRESSIPTGWVVGGALQVLGLPLLWRARRAQRSQAAAPGAPPQPKDSGYDE
jgi:MFS family permease